MLYSWNYIIVAIIILGTIFIIISENRNPVKTIAWCLILIFIPILGIILYILFGMDNRHRRLIKEEDYQRLKGRTASIQKGDICTNPPEKYQLLIQLMSQVNNAFPLNGNKVEILTDFSTMSDKLIQDISKAKYNINLLFFKFENDAAGNRVADALIAKAAEGVEVRLVYDAVGNITVPRRFYRKLKKNGIQVKSFIKVYLPFLSRYYNSRNHRKVVVIDGNVGYMGGMNIAQRYAEGLKWGVWRDTHLRITGPAVSELQTSFLVDWKFSSRKKVDLESMYPYNPPCGDSLMQIVTGGAMDKWNNIMQGYMKVISRSSKYIYIQSPYFIPPEPIMKVLQNAALSGVDVRIMMPYRGDRGILPPWASRSYIQEALEAGIKVYLYRKGYMHAKTLVCDDDFVTIGSTNIDSRGFELDFEINAFIYDEKLAKEQKNIFLADQEDSELLNLEEWKKRPIRDKIRESFARIFSPLL